MHAVLIGLAVVAIVGYVIGRQLAGEPLRGRRLIILPIVLTVIGAVDLHGKGHLIRPVDIACIAASGLIVAAIGALQGRSMRLESRGGTLWGQLPVKDLWLWLALVLSRMAMTALAYALHAHVAASTEPILLLLGVNRLAQAAVVASRAVIAGIPFAPEKDGQTFLGGMFDGSRGVR
jgi:hypothetical protein